MWKINVLLFILFHVAEFNSIPPKSNGHKFVDNPSVKLLQEYIQIDTSKEKNIELAVNYWERQAADIELPFAVYRPAGKPICVITWTGANTTLPSIILNSHMDVVPVDEQKWIYEPYSGYIDDNGDMYGRGTQDTKAVAIHYLEAIRRLKEENVTLQRTIHITLMPDEETGGSNGIVAFMKTDNFSALKPGFFFDEGTSSSDDMLYATFQDKRPWQFYLNVHGEGGHGSTIPSGTAMEKVHHLLNIIMKFREQQKQIMISKEAIDFGSYTTLNVNMIKGGVVPNVIPSVVSMAIDMRLAVSVHHTEMDSLIQSWIAQVGNDTELSFIQKHDISEATRLDDTNSYWVAIVEALREMDLKITPIVCTAKSDMMHIRNSGIPAIGFAYRPHTVARLHAADEYLNMDTFLKGIDVYAQILKKVGNLL